MRDTNGRAVALALPSLEESTDVLAMCRRARVYRPARRPVPRLWSVSKETRPMETREKIAEVCDLLRSLLGPKTTPRIVRAFDLAPSALGDFFSDEDDTATITTWFEDEMPFPAA